MSQILNCEHKFDYSTKAIAELVYKTSSALVLPQLCREGTGVLEQQHLCVWEGVGVA